MQVIPKGKSPKWVPSQFLPLADALAAAGLWKPRGLACFPAYGSSVARSQMQLALRTHCAFSRLFPSPPAGCPRPPSTFRTRDCLAREPGGLQQVLGEKLDWTTFLWDVPPFPFPWEWLNTRET